MARTVRPVSADEHARIEALTLELDAFLRPRVQGQQASGNIAFAALMNVATHIVQNAPPEGREMFLTIGVMMLASVVPSAVIHMGPMDEVFPDGPPSTSEPTKH